MAEATPPGSTIREQQRAFTRERLLQAGEDVFARRGYTATTIDDIVGAAGASRATFYLHFHTKADVIAELGARLVPEVAQLYRELDEVLALDSRAAMRVWMVRAMTWMEEHRTVIAAGDAARLLEGPEASATTITFADQMPRYLARWPSEARRHARTRVALLTTQFRATFTFPFVEGPEDESQVGSDTPDRAAADLVDTMTDIWLTALRPADGPAAGGSPTA